MVAEPISPPFLSQASNLNRHSPSFLGVEDKEENLPTHLVDPDKKPKRSSGSAYPDLPELLGVDNAAEVNWGCLYLGSWTEPTRAMEAKKFDIPEDRRCLLGVRSVESLEYRRVQ
jgi:hypothetical protein